MGHYYGPGADLALGIQWWARQSPSPHGAMHYEMARCYASPHSFMPTAWLLFLTFDLSWTPLDFVGGRRRSDDIFAAFANSGKQSQSSFKELVIFQINAPSLIWTIELCLSVFSRFSVEAAGLLHIKSVFIKHINMVGAPWRPLCPLWPWESCWALAYSPPWGVLILRKEMIRVTIENDDVKKRKPIGKKSMKQRDDSLNGSIKLTNLY